VITSILFDTLGLGNYTSKLYAKAKDQESMTIRVDGPYGNLNLNYRRYPIIIFVAGGIGITPILGMLKDIYRVAKMEPEERKTAVQNVHLVWSIQHAHMYRSFQQDMNQLQAESEKRVNTAISKYAYN
jgi:predicted ferric reductase